MLLQATATRIAPKSGRNAVQSRCTMAHEQLADARTSGRRVAPRRFRLLRGNRNERDSNENATQIHRVVLRTAANPDIILGTHRNWKVQRWDTERNTKSAEPARCTTLNAAYRQDGPKRNAGWRRSSSNIHQRPKHRGACQSCGAATAREQAVSYRPRASAAALRRQCRWHAAL